MSSRYKSIETRSETRSRPSEIDPSQTWSKNLCIIKYIWTNLWTSYWASSSKLGYDITKQVWWAFMGLFLLSRWVAWVWGQQGTWFRFQNDKEKFGSFFMMLQRVHARINDEQVKEKLLAVLLMQARIYANVLRRWRSVTGVAMYGEPLDRRDMSY